MQVALKWNTVTNATSYNIYRSIFLIGGYSLAAAGVTSTNYTDGPGDLVNGQTYYYKISAVSSDGEGLLSSAITATAPAFPAAPTGGTATVT